MLLLINCMSYWEKKNDVWGSLFILKEPPPSVFSLPRQKTKPIYLNAQELWKMAPTWLSSLLFPCCLKPSLYLAHIKHYHFVYWFDKWFLSISYLPNTVGVQDQIRMTMISVLLFPFPLPGKTEPKSWSWRLVGWRWEESRVLQKHIEQEDHFWSKGTELLLEAKTAEMRKSASWEEVRRDDGE